jgi:hypothetical protein
MNGRFYDSKLHRFLQPGNNIQDPFNTQNYNRYGYVVNNPLKYTDPSGEIFGFVLGFLFSTYVHGGAASGGETNPFKWNSSTWISAVSGTTSSVASFSASTGLNRYTDNYNNKPVLGASAIGPGFDIPSFVNNNKYSFSNDQNSTYKNNFNSSLTHDIYRVTPNTSWDLKSTDWEKVAGKTNEIATSITIITAGLEAAGKATPLIKSIGGNAAYFGTFVQVADNGLKFYKGEANGGISSQLFGYRMTGIASSWAGGYIVAGSYGGPYGVLASVIIGGGFQGLEYSYNVVAPQIQASYDSFINNLYSASYNAQFSGR